MSVQQKDYRPFLADTQVLRRPMGPSAYDWVRVLLIRDGSAILIHDSQAEPVAIGNAVLIGPREQCRFEPEEPVTLTTVYLDSDYVADQVFWQHSGFFPDRNAAVAAVEEIYPDPVQVVRLGEHQMKNLAPLLDELVTLSASADSPARFFRIQALVSMLVDALLPQVARRCPPQAPLKSVHLLPSAPRWRRFRPVRREALAVEALLRSDLAKRWTLATLCEQVHLSSKQLVRIFVDAFGKTPHTYLTMLRVEEMTRLLRETDLPVTRVMRLVGWNSRGHAAQILQRHVGVTPTDYRRFEPQPLPTMDTQRESMATSDTAHGAPITSTSSQRQSRLPTRKWSLASDMSESDRYAAKAYPVD